MLLRLASFTSTNYVYVSCSCKKIWSHELQDVISSCILYLNSEEIFYGHCNYANSLTVTQLLDLSFVKILQLYPNLNYLKVLRVNRVKTNVVNSILQINHENLCHLNLDDNGIDEYVFEYAPNLKTVRFLSLRHNNVSKIERKSIDTFNELQQLDLSYNFIDIIEGESFRNQGKLQLLSLKNNKITDVGEKTFTGLQNLAVLDLSQNFITRLDFAALKHLTSLSKFNFDLGKKSVRLRSNLLINDLEKLISISNNSDFLKTLAGEPNSSSHGIITIDFNYWYDVMKKHKDQSEKLQNLETLQKVNEPKFDTMVKIWVCIVSFLILDLILALSISISYLNYSFAVCYRYDCSA